MLAGAEAMARQTNPVVPVQRRLVTGGAAAVLIEQAAKVEMVVLGDRGLGGFAGLPVGSIALQVATHSPVPVLIVKGNIAAEGPVMVHGDGGLARTEAAAEHVMAWARREARGAAGPAAQRERGGDPDPAQRDRTTDRGRCGRLGRPATAAARTLPGACRALLRALADPQPSR